MHPPTGYTWTSEESFSDAGSPAVLHSSEEGAPRREGVEACNDLGASEKGVHDFCLATAVLWFNAYRRLCSYDKCVLFWCVMVA